MTSCILIVDDNQTVSKLATKILSNQGYQAVAATSGMEGAERLESHNPILAIVDVKLPDGSSYEFVKAWRAAGCDVPVIMTSGYPERDVKTSETSADPFLAKPFRPSDLRALITRVLGDHEDNGR